MFSELIIPDISGNYPLHLNWIKLAQDREKSQALLKTAMNILVP
jgi:hypothetical protein